MRIAIISDPNVNQKEGKMLSEAADELAEGGAVIDINNLILEASSGNTNVCWTEGDFLDYDIYLVRDVWHAARKAVTIINWLKWQGKFVVDNHLSEVRYTIDKIREAFDCAHAGLPVPKTVYPHSEEHFLKSIDEIGYPVIIKSNITGKGTHVYKCNQEEDVEDWIKQSKKKKRLWYKYVIQEYIPYKRDLRVFVLGDEAVAVMHRIPKPGEFKANYSFGGEVEMVELTPEIKSLAEQAAKATVSEFAGVDLLETDRRNYYILEVNRTPGFAGISKATGQDFGKKIIEYCIKKYNEENK